MELFLKDLDKEMTILEISKKAKLSYNAAYRMVKFLEMEGVLKTRTLGPSTVVTLNKNPITVGFLLLAKSYSAKIMEDIKKEAEKLTKWKKEVWT